MKRQAIVMTGATGCVGRSLAERLYAAHDRPPLVFIARGKGDESAEERIQKVLPNVRGTVIEGDVCEGPQLGISTADCNLLKQYTCELWHVAGNTSFSPDEKEHIFRVNLDGTRHVLAFAESLGVKRIHYISTAYVAGDRKGLSANRQAVAHENEDRVGQRFRNPYEESKFLAEMAVKECSKRLGIHTSIYRIGIAVGDSVSGITTSFTGYYAYMRGFHLLRERILQAPVSFTRYGVERRGEVLHIPVAVWGLPHATINMACIDYLCEVMVRLAARPESIGKTFHVVNPTPPQFGWLLESGLRAMQIEGIRMINPLHAPPMTNSPLASHGLERTINSLLASHEDYTLGEPVFDGSNVRAVLGEIPAHPPVDDLLVRRLLAYATEKQFGRTRAVPTHQEG